MSETEVNQEAADRIRSAGLSNGKRYQPGDCLALLDGRVVAVAKDIGSALRALRALEPDPRRGMIVEAGALVTDVIRSGKDCTENRSWQRPARTCSTDCTSGRTGRTRTS